MSVYIALSNIDQSAVHLISFFFSLIPLEYFLTSTDKKTPSQFKMSEVESLIRYCSNKVTIKIFKDNIL